MRQREGFCLLFAQKHSYRAPCLEAQALRAKRVNPGLRCSLSREETASARALSAVGSSQAPRTPLSSEQAPREASAQDAANILPADLSDSGF